MKIIKILLYELQPFRYEDIIIIIKLIKNNSLLLFNEFKSFLIFIYNFNFIQISLKLYFYLFLWLLFFYITFILQFSSLYFIITLILLIFYNLKNKDKNEISAYSVFNNGYERLLGTLTPEQFEREIRHNDQFGEDLDDENDMMNLNNFDNLNDEIIEQNNNNENNKKKKNQYRKKGKKVNRT